MKAEFEPGLLHLIWWHLLKSYPPPSLPPSLCPCHQHKVLAFAQSIHSSLGPLLHLSVSRHALSFYHGRTLEFHWGQANKWKPPWLPTTLSALGQHGFLPVQHALLNLWWPLQVSWYRHLYLRWRITFHCASRSLWQACVILGKTCLACFSCNCAVSPCPFPLQLWIWPPPPFFSTSRQYICPNSRPATPWNINFDVMCIQKLPGCQHTDVNLTQIHCQHLSAMAQRCKTMTKRVGITQPKSALGLCWRLFHHYEIL